MRRAEARADWIPDQVGDDEKKEQVGLRED